MNIRSAIATALLVSAVVCRADDEFPILTTLDGHTFTNAQITSHTPVYAIVVFDGGFERVPFTNLPVTIQTRYGFDQAKAAAKQEADRLAREKAQEQRQRLNATIGEPYPVHVLKVVGPRQYRIEYWPGLRNQFWASLRPGLWPELRVEKDIAIPNLPFKIEDFVNHRNKVRDDLLNARAGSNSTGRLTSGTKSQLAQDLADLERQYQDLMSLDWDTTSITVGKTEAVMLGNPVWKYLKNLGM